jgi:fluoroquinolone transport system permease protein
MSTFAHFLRLDLRLQARSLLYPATAVSTAMICAFVTLLPGTSLPPAATAFFVFMDPATIGLSFVGAMVLAERSSGTLAALGVTPIRPWVYVGAKVVSLTLLTFVSSLIVVGVATRGAFDLVGQLVALTLCSTVAVLIGLFCVAGAASMTGLVVTLLWVTTLLYLPVLSHFGVLPDPLALLMAPIPSYAMLMAIEASIDGAAVSAVARVSAELYLVLWVLVGWRWTLKAFEGTLVSEGR